MALLQELIPVCSYFELNSAHFILGSNIKFLQALFIMSPLRVDVCQSSKQPQQAITYEYLT